MYAEDIDLQCEIKRKESLEIDNFLNLTGLFQYHNIENLSRIGIGPYLILLS